jgi:alkylation response protein AidB-like acyl-CoA dehydrogenase
LTLVTRSRSSGARNGYGDNPGTTSVSRRHKSGQGRTRHFPVERMMRDAKITQVYEGTNRIQRVVMAGQLLKR